jgi:hypothetical protein
MLNPQPHDSTLDALSGLTTAADKLPYFTDIDTATTTPLTALARTLLDDATQAEMQATIGIVPGVGAGPRIRMMADQTFTVAASGGDDTNIAGPFATKQGAMDMIQKEYDLNGYIATIQVEDGADSTGFLTYRGAPFGAAKTDETPIKLRGNNTTPSNCPITIASGTCIHVTAGARIQMSGFKLTAGTGTCLLGAVHSFISVDGPVEFGTAGTHISAASNCNIHISGAYTISGGGGRHVRAVSGSTVFLTGIATISAPITFTAAFLEGVQGGVAGFQNAGAVNPGNVTGPRFNQQNGGIVYSTASTGLQAIPGTSDGVYTNDVGFKPSITVASAATLNLMPVTSGISGNFYRHSSLDKNCGSRRSEIYLQSTHSSRLQQQSRSTDISW